MDVDANGQGGSVRKTAPHCSTTSAAAEVVQRHNRSPWRIARGILGNESDAEEPVQDAHVHAVTLLDAVRGDASLGTWLGRIVISEALRRTERHRPMVAIAEVAERLPQARGDKSLPFDGYRGRPEANNWLPLPPAGGAVFPAIAEIERRNSVSSIKIAIAGMQRGEAQSVTANP